MYRIKLKRIGRNREAVYRIIVTKKKSGFTSGVVGEVGFYKGTGSKLAVIDKEKLVYWLVKGAELSERVSKILEMKIKRNEHRDRV